MKEDPCFGTAQSSALIAAIIDWLSCCAAAPIGNADRSVNAMIVQSGEFHRNGTRPQMLARDIIVAPQFGWG
jgi:hypothetical protein